MSVRHPPDPSAPSLNAHTVVRYAVDGKFPLGPLEQQRMVLILQANIRKKKAAADVNHAKYTRKMVHRIRKVARALIEYEDKKKVRGPT